MYDLSKHEKLEIEVLNGLNSKKLLNHLIFCGGTMLRLCHELNRYSVDLDFWIMGPDKKKELFTEINDYLKENYKLRKSSNKQHSLVFEFTASDYPRNLKIEIRDETRKVKYEERIAFSKHTSIQVMVNAATLEEMMASKVKTFLDRTQIRDVFDIEFLLRRGVELFASKKELTELKRLIKRFKAKDYKISLGSLLEFKDRQYYKTANFRYLLGRIESELNK